MLSFNTLSEFQAHVGQDLGTSEWVTITQEMVNQFAEATGDHQWIHVDIEKAKLHSPFKTTIAHGFLSLSLSPKFMYEMFEVKSVKMGLNYGTNKVRFMSPVPTGSRVRMKAKLKEVEIQAPGYRSVVEAVFEREGADKPVCVAELVSLMFE